MKTLDSQERLVKLLSPCPRPGQGVHPWLYGAVCTLLRHGTPPEAIVGILRPRMTRREQPGEIANTISNAWAELASGKRVMKGGKAKIAHPFRRSSKWPKASAQKMEAIFRSFKVVSIESWEAESKPCKSQERILRWAFAPEEFVCMGAVIEKPNGAGEYYDIKTLSLEGAIRIAPLRQFIVPNPFARRTGKPRRESRLTRATARFFPGGFLSSNLISAPTSGLVIFRSKRSSTPQARLHEHLAREFPLCMLVYSGNESLHGWYATLRPWELMTEAASLGADTRLWSVCQFTRMPWGVHANGTPQRVVFFEPSNLVRSL